MNDGTIDTSMDVIDIDQVLRDLKELGADETTKELILNNVKMYNKLVLDYEHAGIQKNLYLTYQLNVQISKQMLELRKVLKPKDIKQQEEEGLAGLLKSLKSTAKKTKKVAVKKKNGR